ncbi:hypothetical protein ACHQM5_004683 [Ranunculus cassubicifolius]
MESILGFFTLFTLFLFASTIDARKAPDAYWSEVMKDQPMPDAIGRLIGGTPKGQTKTDYHDAKDKKGFTDDFELGPNLFAYHDKKGFTDDFKPGPNLFAYHDKKGFSDGFQPGPNLCAYHNDVEPSEEKSFAKDFEPSVYHGEALYKENKESFAKDFEPIPNVYVYHE